MNEWYDDSPMYHTERERQVAMAVQAGDLVNKVDFVNWLEKTYP